MNVEIRYRPAYAPAVVSLELKEVMQVESGAKVGMPVARIPSCLGSSHSARSKRHLHRAFK